MDDQGREVAVWLHDAAARRIVGITDATQPSTLSRWAIQGRLVREVGAGIWLRADTVQEFRPLPDGTVKQINWMFKSGELLVMWNAVLTIQAFDGPSAAKEIGFRPRE